MEFDGSRILSNSMTRTRRTTRTAALLRSRVTGQFKVDSAIAGLTAIDRDSRCMAALKLGRQGGLEHVAPLELLLDDEELAVEYCARTSLAQIWVRLMKHPPPGQASTDDLLKKLESPYQEERLLALRDLRISRPKAALPRLVAALPHETDPAVTAQLVRTVLAYQEARTRDAMLGYLTHSSLGVRAAAIEGFWGTTDAVVLQAVMPILKEQINKVRGPACVLVIRFGGAASRALAEKLLASQILWMRLAALFALGTLAEPWARQILIRHIRDVHLPRTIRSLAREAIVLSGAGDPDGAVPADAGATQWTDLTRHLPPIPEAEELTRALCSKDPLMRVHGLQNVDRFPPESSLSILTRLVQWETDPLVMATLVKAVARVGGPEQADSVRKFLDHEDPRVRSNALEALSLLRLGPELDAICKSMLMEGEEPRIQKQAAAQLFSNDPDEAVRHFRSMILGEDKVARQNALSILTSFQDNRLVTVLRDALRDPRREVYGQVHDALGRVGPTWEEARELLVAYERGDVAGEIVEGEPVAALLVAMNSPRGAERVRAMRKLVAARDLRIDAVLEINLGFRDSDVVAEATRALRERQRAFTLPRLYLRLGETYVNHVEAGQASVPQHVAEGLPAWSDSEEEDDHGADERLRWVGRALYEAFEDDVELDPDLRATCMDIRAALEQAGTTPTPPTPSRSGSTTMLDTSMVSQAGSSKSRLDTSASAIQIRARTGDSSASMVINPSAAGAPRPAESAASPTGPGESAAAGAGRGSFWATTFAGLIFVVVIVVELAEPVAGPTGTEGATGGTSTDAVGTDRTTRLLGSMTLERRPDRFVERFKDKRITFSGRLVALPDPVTADVRSGTVLFRVKLTRGTQAIQRMQTGQICDVSGTVVSRQTDGTIELSGEVKNTDGG